MFGSHLQKLGDKKYPKTAHNIQQITVLTADTFSLWESWKTISSSFMFCFWLCYISKIYVLETFDGGVKKSSFHALSTAVMPGDAGGGSWAQWFNDSIFSEHLLLRTHLDDCFCKIKRSLYPIAFCWISMQWIFITRWRARKIFVQQHRCCRVPKIKCPNTVPLRFHNCFVFVHDEETTWFILQIS